MKKNIFKSLIYPIFGIFCLISCQNNAIEIQEQVKITVSPSQVLESFVPYESGNLEMEVDDELGTAKLRITALIYDSDGELYSKNIGLLDNYNSDYSFQVLLDPNEEYKLLAFSSSIMGSLENPTAESYKFSGENNLNSLEVTQTSAYSWYSNYSVLGVLDNSLTAGNANMKFNLEPATALVYLNWKNIHATHNFNSNSIYGEYAASAIDLYDNSYSWEITITPGDEVNEVVVENLSPLLSSLGLTSDEGVNVYSGHISGDKLIIPTGQNTGAMDDSTYPIYLLGVNEETFEEEDIIMSVDRVNNTITVENIWGTYSDKNDGGFYELFDSGVKFISRTSGAVEYDKYYIIYHNNDVVKYRDNDFIYSTSLDATQNNGESVTPSLNPNSTNIYDVCNLLPGTFDVFARTFIGNESSDYGNQKVDIKSGQQYVFKFYCASLELEISLGQLKSGLWDPEEYKRQNLVKSGSVINYYHPEKLNITKIEF